MSTQLFRGGSNRPGFLVTIDGPNGSGKTALTAGIGGRLAAAGVEHFATKEPSPGAFGDLVRDSESSLRGRALACLVAADRHAQAEGELSARLESGLIVICDRYVESSLVLQRLDEVDTEFIVAINSEIPRPDLRILLRASPAVLAGRLAARRRDPARRFERDAGPGRELELYAEAEALLAGSYDLAATIYDTTTSDTDELAARATELILSTRRGEPG